MTIGKKYQFGNSLAPFIRIGVAVLGVLLLAVIVSRIVYPFGSGPWEAFNWMPAAHLLEGKNPYAFGFAPPYGMSPYGIVFYGLLAVGLKFFGFQLWFGKILSVAAFAVCVFFTSKITWRITGSKEAVWFACLAALAMFPSQTWIAIVRADLIAAAFSISAIYLAFTLDAEKKTRALRIAGLVLLSAAAFFTKQTFLLAPAIIILRFAQLKKWREGILFVLAIAVLIAAGIFLLNYTSSGGYIWQHFLHAKGLPFSVTKSTEVLFEMLKAPAFLFSIIFLIVFGYRNRTFDLAEKLSSPGFTLFAYVLLSLAWAFLSSGRQGGGPNYYIENSFAMAIGCALAFQNFKKNTSPRLAFALVIVLALGGAFQQVRVLRGEYFRRQSLSYYREVFETVGKLTPAGSRCISIYPELVVWNGCEFNFDDFEEYDGGWTPELRAVFEREVGAGNYAVIVWYNDKLHERFPNYRLVPMSQKLPERHYPVFLYARETK